MRNRRCRLDGGLSTGPTTQEGIERIRKARTKHGSYSAERKAARREFIFHLLWSSEQYVANGNSVSTLERCKDT